MVSFHGNRNPKTTSHLKQLTHRTQCPKEWCQLRFHVKHWTQTRMWLPRGEKQSEPVIASQMSCEFPGLIKRGRGPRRPGRLLKKQLRQAARALHSRQPHRGRAKRQQAHHWTEHISVSMWADARRLEFRGHRACSHSQTGPFWRIVSHQWGRQWNSYVVLESAHL